MFLLGNECVSQANWLDGIAKLRISASHALKGTVARRYDCIEQHATLQGNVLRSTKGIQLLPHLEELDLRYNLIASIHEVVRLSGALSSPSILRAPSAA